MSLVSQRPNGQHQVFFACSYAKKDHAVTDALSDVYRAFGYKLNRGDVVYADSVSKKVVGLIRDCSLFVGVFTCNEVLSSGKYNTSPWVNQEATYALLLKKRMILYVETGVALGGIFGDHEFIAFRRRNLTDAIVRTVQILAPPNAGSER